MSEVVNGNRQEESHDQSHDQQCGDESRDNPADMDEATTITDTPEGEDPIRRDVVKRTLPDASPGLELQAKKRKT